MRGVIPLLREKTTYPGSHAEGILNAMLLNGLSYNGKISSISSNEPVYAWYCQPSQSSVILNCSQEWQSSRGLSIACQGMCNWRLSLVHMGVSACLAKQSVSCLPRIGTGANKNDEAPGDKVRQARRFQSACAAFITDFILASAPGLGWLSDQQTLEI